ncbi:type II toxin-antitoxin system VapC family toxin [Microbacterium panaciterrae]|uniref:Ribonuclease VapC n=1 Tax=Microbacterium panaciterrae TaxID=985759 RepID=A0ABP8PIY3_9MICO
MLAYFDTSAVVPLIIAKPTSAQCATLWDAADLVATSSLTLVEVHAALALAQRRGRIDDARRRAALESLHGRWAAMAHVFPSEAIVRHAAELTATQGLRGYDAIHCATALALDTPDFVAVSSDRTLLRAWAALGIPTAVFD